MKTVAVIPGDDAAPEAVHPVVDMLQSLQLDIEWVYPITGHEALDKTGEALPEESRQIIDSADTTLFGSTSGPSGAALMYLRWGKTTYANVRPCKYFPGGASPLRHPENIDFVIVRENLEDLYVGVEGDLEELASLQRIGRTSRRSVSDLAPGRYAIKVISKLGTERIVRFAFDLAAQRDGKRRVTCVSKHNMLRETDGYFVEVARSIADDYPDIEFDTFIVDDFACRMIREPQRFDVVVTPNLYGDILSDAAGGLLGSLGMAPSGCYGDDYAYFEPAHGTAPDIAGQNVINPTATLLSASMMLEYLGYWDAAREIVAAVEAVYQEGVCLTLDQGGTASTLDFIAAVTARL